MIERNVVGIFFHYNLNYRKRRKLISIYLILLPSHSIMKGSIEKYDINQNQSKSKINDEKYHIKVIVHQKLQNNSLFFNVFSPPVNTKFI